MNSLWQIPVLFVVIMALGLVLFVWGPMKIAEAIADSTRDDDDQLGAA